MNNIEKKLAVVQHGFKPFEEEARNILNNCSRKEAKNTALLYLKNDLYQVRCAGVFILGFIARQDQSVLNMLKKIAKTDESWQVQEVVAKAFDYFCKDNGYEKSLSNINQWINDQNPNVCRAVTEGLRIWTQRPYFNENPQHAIDLISINKANASEYLRKSVGNSLRDIAKKHQQLIDHEISTWNLSDKNIVYTLRYVVKTK